MPEKPKEISVQKQDRKLSLRPRRKLAEKPKFSLRDEIMIWFEKEEKHKVFEENGRAPKWFQGMVCRR